MGTRIVSMNCALCAVALLVGCMPKMTIEELKEEMPQRPPELDQLNDFVGKWESTGQADFAFLDETLKTHGNWEANWEGDGRYLVTRHEGTIEKLGTMTGLETSTYDSNNGMYRSTWTDSFGSVGIGHSTYDADTRTWHLVYSTLHGPWGKSTMKGTMKLVNDDTMDWSWTEYMGWTKTAEMSGTARRVE